jgi:hypothetical protein
VIRSKDAGNVFPLNERKKQTTFVRQELAFGADL